MIPVSVQNVEGREDWKCLKPCLSSKSREFCMSSSPTLSVKEILLLETVNLI